MKQPLESLKERKNILEAELAHPHLDHQKRKELQRELSSTTALINLQEKIASLEKNIQEIIEQLDTEKDSELQQLYKQELVEFENEKQKTRQELEEFLYPKDPLDERSVFLEVRAGTGGQEAALFASDLLKMYTNYALKNNWNAQLVDESFTDLGGIREATLHIEGKGVYGALKFEAGVHRVQRVPKTETAGRIHTSTATVAVFPEVEDVDISINPSDLRIDTFRSGGAGGQHVNKTESAIRITHIPTNIVVTCQTERSQHKNKAKALKALQSRLFAYQKEKQDAAMGKQRKEMVGTGQRAEKVRTYNFPQNRVTDHNAEITLQKLDRVILGDLDEIVDALKKKEQEQRKSSAVVD